MNTEMFRVFRLCVCFDKAELSALTTPCPRYLQNALQPEQPEHDAPS